MYSLLVALHADFPMEGAGDLLSSSPTANGDASQLGRLILICAIGGESTADGMTIWPPDPMMADITPCSCGYS